MDTIYYTLNTRRVKVSGGADLLTFVPAPAPAPAERGQVLDFARCRQRLETREAWKELSRTAEAVSFSDEAPEESLPPQPFAGNGWTLWCPLLCFLLPQPPRPLFSNFCESKKPGVLPSEGPPVFSVKGIARRRAKEAAAHAVHIVANQTRCPLPHGCVNAQLIAVEVTPKPSGDGFVISGPCGVGPGDAPACRLRAVPVHFRHFLHAVLFGGVNKDPYHVGDTPTAHGPPHGPR